METKNYIEVQNVQNGKCKKVVKLDIDANNTFSYVIEDKQIKITVSNMEPTKEEIQELKQQKERDRKIDNDYRATLLSQSLTLVALAPQTLNDLESMLDVPSLESRIFWDDVAPYVCALTDEEIEMLEERTGKHIMTIQGEAVRYYIDSVFEATRRATAEKIKKCMGLAGNNLSDVL